MAITWESGLQSPHGPSAPCHNLNRIPGNAFHVNISYEGPWLLRKWKSQSPASSGTFFLVIGSGAFPVFLEHGLCRSVEHFVSWNSSSHLFSWSPPWGNSHFLCKEQMWYVTCVLGRQKELKLFFRLSACVLSRVINWRKRFSHRWRCWLRVPAFTEKLGSSSGQGCAMPC